MICRWCSCFRIGIPLVLARLAFIWAGIEELCLKTGSERAMRAELLPEFPLRVLEL